MMVSSLQPCSHDNILALKQQGMQTEYIELYE